MNRIIFLICILVFPGLSSWAENKVKFPVVSEVTGAVELSSKSGNSRTPKKGEILKDRAHIHTKLGAKLRLQLDEQTGLLVFENTDLEIPAIDALTGDIREIQLMSGQVRVDSHGDNQRIYSTPITSDVYTQADFLLSYNTATSLAGMICFRGELNFRGIEAETSSRIGAGERSYFQGVMEAGAPAFDVLMKGRKIARGKLGPVDSLPAAELEQLNKISAIPKPVVVKPPPEAVRQPGQICEKPFAKLNECVWTCEGMPKHPKRPIQSCDAYDCVRRRCDANGNWADDYKVPASAGRCQVKPQIAPCDY